MLSRFAPLALLALTAPAFAQCNPQTSGPDVIVGDLWGIAFFGATNGISAFSIATDSCNTLFYTTDAADEC